VHDTSTILSIGLAIYVIGSCLFLISENRNPQATLAWMLAFILAPGLGLLLYVFFGRDWKAFSRRRKLARQELGPDARPLLAPLTARQDAAISELGTQSTECGKLLRLVRHNSPSLLTTRNEVHIQQDAATFYPNLIEDMKGARHSIHHEYYIWRSDEVTGELAEILAAKSHSGVQVRLLVGSYAGLHRSYVRAMQRAGVRIVTTSPRYRLHDASYRNHRKITVIDGLVGYTGGMNIGREHLEGGPGFDAWRDTQLRIVGDGVAALQAVFAVDWYNAMKEELFTDEYFPPGTLAAPRGDVPVQIVTSGPDARWAAIRQLYFGMVASARHHVYVQSPYFILDPSLAEALRSAAFAGIDVRVMVSSKPSGDKVPAWASNTYMVDAALAGVRVYLYTRGYLHAKTISIDSMICSIGSANIDIRSFSINYELNAVLYSERLATQLEHDFERDLRECVEFDAEAYQRRGAALRLRDSVARLFSPLL
jgi:cardiolipin synthase